MSQARQEYEKLIRWLATLDPESKEADAIRDESDPWWYKMTEAEKQEMRVLSAQLQDTQA